MDTLPARVRFGPFELDVKAGELRSLPEASGVDHDPIVLSEQPFRLLLMLVERGGEIVTREEIQKRFWPNDTIVEFDHSINVAINKLRKALGDSADQPKYIATVAHRGYRLMVGVECPPPANFRSFLPDLRYPTRLRQLRAKASSRFTTLTVSLARRCLTTAFWKWSVAAVWVWCTKPKT